MKDATAQGVSAPLSSPKTQPKAESVSSESANRAPTTGNQFIESLISTLEGTQAWRAKVERARDTCNAIRAAETAICANALAADRDPVISSLTETIRSTPSSDYAVVARACREWASEAGLAKGEPDFSLFDGGEHPRKWKNDDPRWLSIGCHGRARDAAWLLDRKPLAPSIDLEAGTATCMIGERQLVVHGPGNGERGNIEWTLDGIEIGGDRGQVTSADTLLCPVILAVVLVENADGMWAKTNEHGPEGWTHFEEGIFRLDSDALRVIQDNAHSIPEGECLFVKVESRSGGESAWFAHPDKDTMWSMAQDWAVAQTGPEPQESWSD